MHKLLQHQVFHSLGYLPAQVEKELLHCSDLGSECTTHIQYNNNALVNNPNWEFEVSILINEFIKFTNPSLDHTPQDTTEISATL